MQLYVLDRCPIKAAEMLAEFPRRAMATNLREGQQILSVCLHERGLPTLLKQDGSRYSGVNHKNHPLVRWFAEKDSRVDWLLWHLDYHTANFYLKHWQALRWWYDTCEATVFDREIPDLDSVPWFPAKEYEGPAGDIKIYLEWKYGTKKETNK